MAIAVNAQTNLTSTASESSWSFNHTCAGSDRILLVFVSVMKTASDGIAISSCTFGGTNMTSATTRGWNDTGRTRSYRQEIYYLINPPTTEQAVAVTTSALSTATVIAAVSLTGVLQSGTMGGSSSKDLYQTTDISQAVTTTAANSWLVGGAMLRQPNASAITFSPGTDVGEWFDLSSGGSATADISAVGGYKLVAAAGSATVDWTGSVAGYGLMVAVEVKAAAGGTLHTATADDGLDLSDAPTRRGMYRATATETLDLLDALTPRRALRAVVVESMGLAGGMGGRATIRPALADLLDLLGVAAGAGRVAALAADALDVTGAAGPKWTLRRAAGDTWRLTAATARRADWRPTVADGLTLAGSASLPVVGESGELHLLPDADATQSVGYGDMNLVAVIFNVNNALLYVLKINNLDIPPGATIDAANLELYTLTQDDPGLSIRAQASASPADFTTTEYDISNRTLTEAAVLWSAANVGTNQYVTTPDFAAVIQEVIDLPQWTRGSSDLVIVLTNVNTGSFINGSTLEGANPPYLNISWHIGGLVVTAAADDLLAVLEDAERRAIIGAAVADSASWSAAATMALSLLIAEEWQLSETVLTLARLAVDDALLLGDAVYLTYALSLTEPLTLQVALQRIAAMRAAPVEALRYSEAMRTVVNTSAGDALALTDALTARRVLAALLRDAVAYGHLLNGDMAGLLDAIVTERVNLSAAAAAGWHSHPAAGDAVEFTATVTALRRLLALAADAQALGDVAAFMKRARATAGDAAEFADALRLKVGTRAADELELSAAAIAGLLSILRAVAADAVTLGGQTAVAWRVTARDSLEFAATLAALMHWIESVSDALDLRGVAVTLLPNGIVRIEFAIMGASVAFEIAMPRADMALNQPRIDIEPHGLTEL